ncbi:MAG: hypothetical protein GY778_25805 [bacterium]|nr:hypothetical protein [bacterium]
MTHCELASHVGDVELWWIPRPRSPRTSLRRALLAGAVLLPGIIAAAAWGWAVVGDARGLWPWSREDITGAQILLRYLSVLVVAWGYVVLRSAPAWVRARRLAREDLAAAEHAVADTAADPARWRRAGVHLHRSCLLRREVWPGLPQRVGELDEQIRRHLRPGRRLYIYYPDRPPPLPETPEAGFEPRVVLSAVFGWWTIPMFVVLASTVYAELTGSLKSQQWFTLRVFNFVVLASLLLALIYTCIMALMGRRQYFRFAPGVAELLSYGIIGRHPTVQAIGLREGDVVLDLTGSSIVLGAFQKNRGRPPRRHYLARSPEVIETCLRAVLSTAAVRPLPETQLVD